MILSEVALMAPVQDASPFASDTRNFPAHGDPPPIVICHER